MTEKTYIYITMGSRRNRGKTKDPSQKKEVMERIKRYLQKGKTQKAIVKRGL